VWDPQHPAADTEERGGELGEVTFTEHLELQLSTKPKLEDENHDGAGACTLCVCACRNPGQNHGDGTCGC